MMVFLKSIHVESSESLFYSESSAPMFFHVFSSSTLLRSIGNSGFLMMSPLLFPVFSSIQVHAFCNFWCWPSLGLTRMCQWRLSDDNQDLYYLLQVSLKLSSHSIMNNNGILRCISNDNMVQPPPGQNWLWDTISSNIQPHIRNVNMCHKIKKLC